MIISLFHTFCGTKIADWQSKARKTFNFFFTRERSKSYYDILGTRVDRFHDNARLSVVHFASDSRLRRFFMSA